jgi:hypothetical protein
MRIRPERSIRRWNRENTMRMSGMFSLLKQVYHILLRFARGVDQRTRRKPRLFERQRSGGFLAKRQVLLLSKMSITSCGPFFPLCQARKRQWAGHRPAIRTPEWRDWLCAFPPPLRWAPSRSHAALLRPSTTEERRKKPPALAVGRSVTYGSYPLRKHAKITSISEKEVVD